MVRAETDITTNPSGVIRLTRKGERYVDAHQPSLTGPAASPAAFPRSGVPDTGQGEKPPVRPALARGESIAARNADARLSIAGQVEELLRIRRDADALATYLIELLDLHNVDPDLEPEEDESDLELDAEPSIGWSSTINQTAAAFHGPRTDYDAEGEHDGAEPDYEGAEEDWSEVPLDPAYLARLRARRAGKAVRP